MSVEYQIRLKDVTTGDVYAVLASGDGILRPFTYGHYENAPGRATIPLNGHADVIADIGVDDAVEIWRYIPERDVDWYLEWEGFFRSPDWFYNSQGDLTYTMTCRGYLDLCRRAIIGYRKTEARATKNDVTETVMKEFVSENIGPDATDPPRLDAQVVPGLTIEADGAGGPNWQGERGYKNLLKVLQEIGKANTWDFDIVGTGPATYEFRTYEDQRGDNRALPVDPSTGRNAYGFIPVVFSTELGTMQIPRYAVNRNDEGGVCYVLGDTTPPRTIVIRENTDSTGQSPLNRWEFVKSAQNAAAGDLAAIGDAELESKRFQEIFTFQVLQTAELVYGRDYFWGDIVTGVFEEIERNKKITNVTVQVTEREEVIDIGLQDTAMVNRTTPLGKLVDRVKLLAERVEDLEITE